ISFILVAFRKTAVQAIIFLVVTIISTIISFWQVKTNGLIGAAVTYTFSMTILAFALAIVLIRQLALFKKQWNEEDINEITDHYTCL
ncbi:MAG: hypothetical protein II802_02040, partial [Clostridia bacterium]|nr:hypothetical protein [Clostridia bacterium]